MTRKELSLLGKTEIWKMKQTERNTDNRVSINMPKKYGSVYTPAPLSEFVAKLLCYVSRQDHKRLKVVLDPACGEGALLLAIRKLLPTIGVIGVDRDAEAITNISFPGKFVLDDFLLPRDQIHSFDYWRDHLKCLSAVIANPPWSTEKVYDGKQLESAGFKFARGQYDAYVLFLELCLNAIPEGAYYAFIIPDSFFAGQNEQLRKWLLENTELRIVTRLGEKLFPNIFRATTVVVGRRIPPTKKSYTICFRLDTVSRGRFLAGQLDLMKAFLIGAHKVAQRRFLSNPMVSIDVDTTEDEHALLDKLRTHEQTLSEVFKFGRGVEISKSGHVMRCVTCGMVRGYRRTDLGKPWKCKWCGSVNSGAADTTETIVYQEKKPKTEKMYVGESLFRYRLCHPRYIVLNIPGINYKNSDVFSWPKILIRKTGLGIYAAVDQTSAMTNQTVYILTVRHSADVDELYYYLGMINSRVVYYYYLKMYGENEWKSHPYLTKDVIFTLPVPIWSGDKKDMLISEMAKRLSCSFAMAVDYELEKLIMERYELTDQEKSIIARQMNGLPDLSSINDMRM